VGIVEELDDYLSSNCSQWSPEAGSPWIVEYNIQAYNQCSIHWSWKQPTELLAYNYSEDHPPKMYGCTRVFQCCHKQWLPVQKSWILPNGCLQQNESGGHPSCWELNPYRQCRTVSELSPAKNNHDGVPKITWVWDPGIPRLACAKDMRYKQTNVQTYISSSNTSSGSPQLYDTLSSSASFFDWQTWQ